MGYRSYAFRWFFGYSVAAEVPPPTLCPCPEYGHDATLVNEFTNIQTLVSGFTNDETLGNQFSAEQTLSNQFNNDQTLTNQWGKRNCNG